MVIGNLTSHTRSVTQNLPPLLPARDFISNSDSLGSSLTLLISDLPHTLDRQDQVGCYFLLGLGNGRLPSHGFSILTAIIMIIITIALAD